MIHAAADQRAFNDELREAGSGFFYVMEFGKRDKYDTNKYMCTHSVKMVVFIFAACIWTPCELNLGSTMKACVHILHNRLEKRNEMRL